jgi:ABC-2 type transport system permease protein
VSELSAVLTIAYRDQLKFVRDPMRIVSTFVFPLIFIAFFGAGMRAGVPTSYDYLVYTFTGVLAMTLYQSTAMGLISVIEDRENDFSQEIFVSPISRYSIVLGKIWGETAVALTQGAGILVIGGILGVPLTQGQVVALAPVSLLVCLLGGSFGLLVLSNLTTQRAANQAFPFLMLPQYFLAGVFTPNQALPPVLDGVARLAPMRYAVDLTRAVYYAGTPDYERVVLDGAGFDLGASLLFFAVCVVIGTWLFARRERNK